MKSKFTALLLALFMVFMPLAGIVRADEKDEGAKNFVNRCYQIALGRDADEDGFNFWLGQLKDGKLTGTGTALLFITSEEYKSKNTSDEVYINDLYTLFMGRKADTEGYEFWKKNISTLGRNGVFDGFANSEEFYNLCIQNGITPGYYSSSYNFDRLQKVNIFVDRFYECCFNRKGDKGGQQYWVQNLLDGKITGVDCASFFIFSDEYISLYLSDEDYVESLYKLFMGRASEEGGKAFWVSELKKGSTREQVFAGFASAPEFQKICDMYGIPKGTFTPIGRQDPKKPADTPSASAKPTTTSTATPAPTTATSVPTTASTTPTPACSVKLLELDGNKNTWVTTTEPCYFITDYTYVFIDKDVKVRGDTAKVIDDIFKTNEKNTGLSYSGKFLTDVLGYDESAIDDWNSIDFAYLDGAFQDVPKDHSKFSIFVTERDGAQPFSSCRTVLVNPCDLDFEGEYYGNGEAFGLPHELLHVLHFNNGYSMSSIIDEGFTTTFTYDTIRDVDNYDIDEIRYRNNYGYIKYEITKDNAETLFLNGFEDNWDSYLYGYRLGYYLRLKYGDNYQVKLLEAANTFKSKDGYSNLLSASDAAAALKKAFGQNIFKDFGQWYTANMDLFEEKY
ncbi:MAG: DUF4214 domain-containing protein [Clostridia bacterium]|nr:DUF4214 domain-containing protein [Clostridia bacterium]